MTAVKERTAATPGPYFHQEAARDGHFEIWSETVDAREIAIVNGEANAALIVRAVNSFTALENRIAELEKAAEDWRQKYLKASNALWLFENPPDPATLREAADAIDCGPDCQFGSVEWDTNAHNCSKRDCEGCPGDLASHLRVFAGAIEARAALSEAAGEKL